MILHHARSFSRPLIRACVLNSKKLSDFCHKDHLDITNIIHEYLWHLDAFKPQQFAELFMPNGICVITKQNMQVKGHKDLMDLCVKLHTRFPKVLHTESNIIIQGNSSHATNHSYWFAYEGGTLISSGRHIDTFARDPVSSLWKIDSRIIEHHWTIKDGFEAK
jgi:hypothetical protein